MTLIERDSLCVPCQKIFQLKPKKPHLAFGKNYELRWGDKPKSDDHSDKANHHMTFEEFESCGKERCHLCLLLLNEVLFDKRKLLRDPSPEKGVIALQHAERELASMIDLVVWYPFSARVRISQPTLGLKIILHLYAEGDQTIKTKTPVKVESLDTGADSSLTTALNWIHNCVKNHDRCRPPTQAVEVLPARLIDVGTASDYSDIRLCPITKIEGDIRYTALSHTWGKQQLITLTNSVRDSFEAGIDWKSLPKTFQHAIQVVRKFHGELNLRFIWIDSLCIVQDSPEDWRQESAKMGHVYKNALCVLAATAGSGGSSGLFFKRDPLSLCPVTLQADWEGFPKGTYICKNTRPFDTDIVGSSLLDRAWVVQERTLARRVLHFTAQQIYWECATVDASEAYPDGLYQFDSTIEKSWSALDFRYKRKRGKHYDPKKADRDIYIIWSHILFYYTKAKLTMPSDKLIAISGIAREMQNHLEGKDNYVAGIWTKNLVHNLLWEVLNIQHGSQQTQYRAPTWSWASLDAQLQLPSSIGEFDKSLVAIHSCEATPAGDDHFSHLISGHLGITGFMVKVLLVPGRVKSNTVQLQLYSGSEQFGKVTTDIDLRLTNNSHDVAWCMPFICCRVHEFVNDTSRPDHLVGLALKPTLRVAGEYERCGRFEVWKGPDYDIFMDAATRERIWIQGYEKHETDSGKYRITIV